MMRVGLFQPVHVKTLASQKRRALLAARKILQEKALAIENDIRGLLRNFGLKVEIVGVVGFEQRIHDLVEGVPELADIMEPLLAARRVLREKFAKLHRKVLLLARDNEVCQRLMTIPGVGPVVSLAFISAVDVPARFRNSKAVGPSLGQTPVLNQFGESHRVGRISLCGDEAMRALLYEAAQVMLTRVQKWSWLKAWAMNIAKRRGQKKAIVDTGTEHAGNELQLLRLNDERAVPGDYGSLRAGDLAKARSALANVELARRLMTISGTNHMDEQRQRLLPPGPSRQDRQLGPRRLRVG